MLSIIPGLKRPDVEDKGTGNPSPRPPHLLPPLPGARRTDGDIGAVVDWSRS